MKPLPNANHGLDSDDKIKLIGVPNGEDLQVSTEIDNLYAHLHQEIPDLLFL